MAQEAAEAVLSYGSATHRFSTWARIGLGLIAVLRREGAAAKAPYGHLEPFSGTMASIGLAVDRLLGLLAQVIGKKREAMKHFEKALDFCEQAGYRPELAWTYCDYANALSQREVPQRRAKAISLLEKSLALSRALEMEPLTERAVANRVVLGA